MPMFSQKYRKILGAHCNVFDHTHKPVDDPLLARQFCPFGADIGALAVPCPLWNTCWATTSSQEWLRGKHPVSFQLWCRSTLGFLVFMCNGSHRLFKKCVAKLTVCWLWWMSMFHKIQNYNFNITICLTGCLGQPFSWHQCWICSSHQQPGFTTVVSCSCASCRA